MARTVDGPQQDRRHTQGLWHFHAHLDACCLLLPCKEAPIDVQKFNRVCKGGFKDTQQITKVIATLRQQKETAPIALPNAYQILGCSLGASRSGGLPPLALARGQPALVLVARCCQRPRLRSQHSRCAQRHLRRPRPARISPSAAISALQHFCRPMIGVFASRVL